MLELGTSNLVDSLLGKPSGRTNNFPQKGCGLNHVTPKFFGKRFEISSKLFELETSNLVLSFAHGMPTGCINNFPQWGHGLGHVTLKIFSIRSNISSKLLELGTSNLVDSLLGKPSGRALHTECQPDA